MNGPLRILVVDDDEVDRLAVRRALAQAGLGAELDEAVSHEDTVARLTTADYDCILLDHYLPGVSGLELLGRVRDIAEATPVVILTGRGDEDLAVELMKGGASDYLPKGSLTPDRLSSAIRHAVELARLEAARRRAEEQRSAEELRFRTLANTIPQLVWTARPDGAVEWYNQRWHDYTGMDVAAAGGWRWAELIHPDHRARVLAGARDSAALGAPWEDTFPLRGQAGDHRWFLTRAVPMRDAAGALAGWFGTATDVTARMEAERAVRENEERFRRAFDIETVGVLFFTLDGTVTRANDAFQAMCGPGGWQPSALLEALRATGRAAPHEIEHVRADGSRWCWLMTARRIAEDECVGFVLDVTARKQAEAERERLLALEQRARGDAERAIRARDDVLAIVAHDLRNPLQTIITSASLTALHGGEPRHRRSLEVIERSTRDMDRLITDLLDVARIEAGSFAVRTAAVGARALLGEAVDRFEAQARARGVEIVIDAGDDVPPLGGDRDALLRVLSNLVGNALRFVPRGGRVVLSARRAGELVELAVADTGSGISSEALPHVFDRFWRADRASRGGAGLGLAICKGIVEAHGGRIWAESQPGQGATFRFVVPRAAPD